MDFCYSLGTILTGGLGGCWVLSKEIVRLRLTVMVAAVQQEERQMRRGGASDKLENGATYSLDLTISR